MRYVDEVIADTSLLLDGNEYVRVTFARCQLAFAGTAGVTFDDCTFVDCQWSFEGPAQETLDFLAALYHGLGPAGPHILNSVVDDIKNGQLGRAALQRSSRPAQAVTR